MKYIQLNDKYRTKVDDADYEYLSQWNWGIYLLRKTKPYARKTSFPHKYMHQFLLEIDTGVDHINGDSLDNRRSNLRPATTKQNAANRGPQKNNTTGYKGVFKRKDYKKRCFRAAIRVDQKLIHLGHFKTKKEAALAYNKASKKYFGEFGYQNKIKD